MTPDLSRATWRKSTRSGGTGGNCIEVARNLPGAVAIRDSKNPHGPKLILTPSTWQAFTAAIQTGHLDLS
jgi:Domain of unknown function (DUF397)